MLRDNKLSVYNSREESASGPTIDEFDLCPRNGVVSVCSAVTQTELASVSRAELGYVLMLEFEPDTAAQSSRCSLLLVKCTACVSVCGGTGMTTCMKLNPLTPTAAIRVQL